MSAIRSRKAACEVIVMTCTNEDDKAVLGVIKALARRDEDKFKAGYVDDLAWTCDTSIPGMTYYLFAAIQKDPETGISDVCGFAKVYKGGSYPVEIDVIASKAETDREMYAGVGTLLIKKIVSYFKQEAKRSPEEEITGIYVHAQPAALPFYLKVGFKRIGSAMSRNLFLSFE